MAIATELVTKFSFVGNLNPLKLFNADLAGGIFLIGEFAGAMVEMSQQVAAFIDQPLQAAKSLQDFSFQTGIAVETVQELGFAASQLGSDVNAVQSSLTGLQQKIGEASLRGSEDFARLGISIRDGNGHLKNADQVLAEVGSRFRSLGLTMAEQRQFASALGIDTSLLQLLNQTGAEISALRKEAQELNVLTGDQTELALDYANALTTLQFATSGIQNQISVGLAPQMTELSEKYTQLLVDNKDLIVNGVTALVEGLGNLGDAFIRLAPFFGAAALAFIALKIQALGFGVVMGAVFSPVVLITAGIIGLLLIIDDLVVAFGGGKSVIADFFQEFFGIDIQPALQFVVDAFNGFLDLLLETGAAWIDTFALLFSGLGKLLSGNFDGALEDIGAAFFKLIEAITLPFQGLFDFITDGIGSAVGGAVGKVGEFFGFGGEETPAPVPEVDGGGTGIKSSIDGAVGKFGELFGFGGEETLVPVSAVAGGGTTIRNNSVEQSNTITVISDDPRTAGKSVNDALQGQLRNASDQIDKGGR